MIPLALHDGEKTPILTRRSRGEDFVMKNRSWLVVCGFVVACGGAIDSPLLEDSGTSGNDASTQPDVGPPTEAGKKDVDVQDAPTVQDVVTVDVPVGPPDSQIHCGQSTCSAQTQVCCATYGTTTTFQCVGSLGDCSGSNQVPISCSSGDNCTSQGNAGFICCATSGGPQNPNPVCSQYDTPVQVQCQQTCDAQQGEFQVGCNPQQTQSCIDPNQVCIASKCTLPGFGICQ